MKRETKSTMFFAGSIVFGIFMVYILPAMLISSVAGYTVFGAMGMVFGRLMEVGLLFVAAIAIPLMIFLEKNFNSRRGVADKLKSTLMITSAMLWASRKIK
jgi:hypothetical protein